MAQPCGPLIDVVGYRVQDAHFTGTSRDFVRSLLSHCQQIVNSAFDSTLVTQPMTVLPQLQVYNFERIAPANDVLRIKAVRADNSRDLSRIDFERLKQISTHWFGRTGRRLETFAVLGRKILVIHPMRPVADSVNVVYTQQLPTLNVDADQVNLPDDQIPTLTKLAEALVLLKQRDLDKLKPLIENLATELKAVKQTQPGMAA